MEYHAVFDAEPEGEMIPTVENALELLRVIYSSPAQPLARRMRAAIAALPFETPKLAVVASMDAPTNFAAKLEAAIARSAGVREMKLISGPGHKSSN